MKPLSMTTVFRRAHDLVAARVHKYSCDAIDIAAGSGAGGSRCPGAKFFWREHFTPSTDSPENYWLRDTDMTTDKKHEWRLTGLLLAAEMTKGML